MANKCISCGATGLFLKLNNEGLCLDCERRVHQNEIESLRRQLSPEQQNKQALLTEIDALNQKKRILTDELNSIDRAKFSKLQEVSRLGDIVAKLHSEIDKLSDDIAMQDFGLYTPRYSFMNAAEYKAKLETIRSEQKVMIKAGTAVLGNTNWTVNGNQSQGKKMVKDMQKLLLRAFNGECDEIVSKVKYSNFDASLKRITTSRDAISNLGKIMGIAISSRYYELKISELTLAFEYQQKLQEEKEAQRAAREAMREEQKLQREIAEARRCAEKEQNHYYNELKRIEKQISAASDDELAALLEKKNTIETQLSHIDKSLKDIDYREANARAGYVYIISNLGSFGENVYKIGMTRRLDPMERIDELGDASVPFGFDVHAMIFSDDAPGLEAALHKAFENKKLNMVNTRREFFAVTLEEIEEVVLRNYDKTVEFVRVPEALQYRTSLKMRESIK